MKGLLHSHSMLRYIALALIVFALIKGIMGLVKKSPFDKTSNKLSLFTLIAFHIQLVLGFGLYFMGPWLSKLSGDGELSAHDRFWSIEHISMMLIAITLVTIGRIRAKKSDNNKAKHLSIVVFFGLALILLFFAIPWPFMSAEIARGWMPS